MCNNSGIRFLPCSVVFFFLLLCSKCSVNIEYSTEKVIPQTSDDEYSDSEYKSLLSLPDIVKTPFQAALESIKELSQTESVEDIDIHAIPYGKQALCTTCTVVSTFFISTQKFQVPDVVLKLSFVQLCSIILTRNVCEGIIDLNLPILSEIVKRKPSLTGEDICKTIFEEYCAAEPVVDWEVQIPKNKKLAKKKSNTFENKPTNLIKFQNEGAETFEIGHVTDTHVDKKYSADSAYQGCREPLCCREYQDKPSSSKERAGPWGNYHKCDVPWSTAEDVLQELASSHKGVKYIYMTGDLVAHNIWETSQESNVKQIREQAAAFRQILGDETQIYAVLGNHEPHPANVLAPTEIGNFSGDWLYEAFYDAWCEHFPPETRTTFMQGGFYTVSPEPGFRIVGLNSLFFYTWNWWQILDPVDPAGQLKWLVDVLTIAEKNKEKVHILSHGPPSEPDAPRVWRREYTRIINRFKSTVVAQFFGHTHRDQFYLFYAPETKNPVAVGWNGGSVTTFTNVNPNYRIYHVNTLTLEVEDFDTFTYNLTEANRESEDKPKWFKLYSFKDAFEVPSLSPYSIDRLANAFMANSKLFTKYFFYYMKGSDVAMSKGCDEKCKEKHLCKIVSHPVDKQRCKVLLGL